MAAAPNPSAPQDPHPFAVEAVLEAVLSKLRILAETGQTFGQPITVGETIIIPYMSLNFGLGGAGGTLGSLPGAGSGHNSSKPGSSVWGGAGGGVRVEPIGFLVVRGERVELLTIDQQPGAWSKVADQALPLLQQWVQAQQGDTGDPE